MEARLDQMTRLNEAAKSGFRAQVAKLNKAHADAAAGSFKLQVLRKTGHPTLHQRYSNS